MEGSGGWRGTGLYALLENWFPIKDSAQAERGLDHPEEGLTRQTLQRDLDASGNTVTRLGLAGRR